MLTRFAERAMALRGPFVYINQTHKRDWTEGADEWGRAARPRKRAAFELCRVGTSVTNVGRTASTKSSDLCSRSGCGA